MGTQERHFNVYFPPYCADFAYLKENVNGT